jgi:hypothetical protein
MIVEDVIIRVRRIFGDEAAVQVSNDDIIRWINDGQVEIVKHNDAALQTTGFMDIVANQSTYALPVDLLILRSLRYKNADMMSYSHLHFTNMQQFDETVDGWDGSVYSSTSPVCFTRYENNVILFPTPDQSTVNGLKLLYNKRPTDVTIPTDTLGLPLIYHNPIMKYCMWQASLLDEDHEPALMYQNNFQNDMGLLMSKETTDPVDKYHTITVLESDM